jgi:DNA ligase (NAD+)
MMAHPVPPPPTLTYPHYPPCTRMIRYANGQLVQAATRGDGRRGDDVTAAALLSGAVPARLGPSLPSGQPTPALLEVRARGVTRTRRRYRAPRACPRALSRSLAP